MRVTPRGEPLPQMSTREQMRARVIHMGTIIGYIVIGLLGGAIAKLILPGKQGGGWLMTMILGIVGALLGGFLGGLIFKISYSEIFSVKGLIFSIVGSIVVLLIYGLITKNRHKGARA